MSEASRRWPWAWPSKLRRMGILGINARNAEYVFNQNAARQIDTVDDKLKTKQVALKCQIRVPTTYAVVHRHSQVGKVQSVVADLDSFVVKPSRGAAGRGILVIGRNHGSHLEKTSGQRVTWADFRYHLSAILSGLYSLGGRPDAAVIEQRIVCHPTFAQVAVDGTPDLRLILYRSIPVMAMIRMPTRISRGRANLHQGAIGAGVDIGSGRTRGGVVQNRSIDVHPDTGAPIADLEIPYWSDILDASIRLADALQLGYVGVDFVVDASQGPVLFEANARPGLAIQIANRLGLQRRLRWIDRQDLSALQTVLQRKELALALAASADSRAGGPV